MSKLSKLVNNPKLFLLDSRAYRRVAVLRARSRAQAMAMPTVAESWHSVTSSDEFRTRVLEELMRRIPVLELSEPGEIRVGILRSAIHDVSEFLYELAHDRGFPVELVADRRTLDVASAELFAVDDFVLGSRTLTAHVSLHDRYDKLPIVFELWEEREDHFIGPTPNRFLRRVSVRTARELGLFESGRSVRARDLHRRPLVLEPDFPIDVVYTWVNHEDPGWRALRASVTDTHVEEEDDDGRSLDRFKNRDELKFSLRSVMRYAPWVRKIFVVTNCAPPDWLDVGHEKIEWVDHRDVFPAACLPTFNSHAIESRLHHVPDLSEHFLYLNDDVFLARHTTPADFFFCNGMSRSFLESSAVVVGDVHPDDPDYLNAARNGKRLLEDDFGRSVSLLHLHMPFALRRDVLLDMEQRFHEPIARTAHSRFRSARDISTVSFLYHHFAYLTGRAMYCPTDAILIKQRTPRYESKLVSLLKSPRRPLSVCLNDGVGSASSPHWNRHVIEFLDAFLPAASELERSR